MVESTGDERRERGHHRESDLEIRVFEMASEDGDRPGSSDRPARAGEKHADPAVDQSRERVVDEGEQQRRRR